MDAKTFKKIKKVLYFSLNNQYSDFYKSKYKKMGLTLKTIKNKDDFLKLPYLTRDEIVSTDPFKRLFIPREKIGEIALTSGTTNSKRPMIILNTNNQPGSEKSYIEKSLELGVKTWLILWPVLAGQNRLARFDYLKTKGIVRVLGDISNLSVSAKIASTLGVDTIQTTPTILNFFIPYLKKEYSLKKIKYIVFGGEFSSEERDKYFKKTFKNAYIKYVYGGNESAARAYRCNFLDNKPPNLYHPSNYYYFEVIGENGAGELIMTHLYPNTAFPLLRYKTGDSVRITSEKCRCGSSTLMEVFGRLEQEVIKVGGAQIYASEVEKALEYVKKYLKTTDFRLHVFEKKYQGKLLPKLKLQLIIKSNLGEPNLEEEIRGIVSENLKISQKFNLSQLVEKEVFLPLEIEFVESFEFTSKQKRIINNII